MEWQSDIPISFFVRFVRDCAACRDALIFSEPEANIPLKRDNARAVKSYTILLLCRSSETLPLICSNSSRAKLLGWETFSVPIRLDSSPHFRQAIQSDDLLSLFKSHLVSTIMQW